VPKPAPTLQTTTLWKYPSQHYREGAHGDAGYRGATPSWVIWNLLERYTAEGELVVDPMAGSGTTLDVARDMGRRALGYDVAPPRKDVFRADARALPLEDAKACFVFADPPYGDNLKYSGQPDCIGELPADSADYWRAMEDVLSEVHRVLRPGRHAAFYVCDVWKRRGFVPVGARLVGLIEKKFAMVDHVAVVRGSKTLRKGNFHKAAEETNFFLRGFNHLLIFRKPESGLEKAPPRRRA
jgi:DNA modification methylase